MKSDLQRLALFGATPAFDVARVVGRPNPIDRARFLERLNRALDSEWLSNMGPLMHEFEARIAEQAGVRHCVSVCNATVGLQLLAADEATGGRPGDEVIVPALTFAATAHAVAWRGLTPVFCEVDPVTGLIDPDHAERLVTPRTRAIIGVHLWGQACDATRLAKIAESNRLRLYFDAAPAVGCTYGDTPVGGLGDAEVFSFHATKVVHSFEGGAVVTNDDALADRLRAARNFGFGADGTVHLVGTNGKLSEASAAMGLTSLETLDEISARNRVNYEQYRRALAGIPGVAVLDYDGPNRNNHHYLMVTVTAERSGLHRDVLLDVLRAENVRARPYFAQPLHLMRPYLRPDTRALPHAEALCGRLLALPTGPQVDADDITRIGEVVRTAVSDAPAVVARHADLAGAARQ
ncbi:aminotransferase class I/II-fold pyridoxal phosphate-dependent enzyme [Micromonospora sp. DT233]|uniref:aminotransferase class I/II-fold pyridoxal phosphate-dependent enzyme n=1 Tax=Micromonospora sp. DT233 TaxID=3393432 RepID=UPI003CF952A0